MNINELFKNKDNEPNLVKNDDKLNILLLNQLLVYGIEDREKEFDNLLSKNVFVLEWFAISSDVAGSLENSNVNVEVLNEDYSTFLLASIELLAPKYALKVVDKAITEDRKVFYNYATKQKCISLVCQCLKRNQKEVLEKLNEYGFINDKAILRTIMLYQNKNLKDVVPEHILNSPELIHEALKDISFKEYKSLLGQEKKEELRNGNIGLFGGSQYSLTDLLLDMKRIDFSDYENKDKMNELLMNIIFTEAYASRDIEERFRDKLCYEKNKQDVIDMKGLNSYQETTKKLNHFVFELSSIGLMDIDAVIKLKLKDETIVDFQFSKWINFSADDEKKMTIIRKEWLEKSLIKKEIKPSMKLKI